MNKLFLLLALLLFSATPAAATLRLVGSSTVFPFATLVAEEYADSQDRPAPIVESTGTGAGFKLLCSADANTPAIALASRPIKETERAACAKIGKTALQEIMLGYDGIVFAETVSSSPLPLTRRDLYYALAARVPVAGQLQPNPHKTWRTVNPALPDRPIIVYGPPPTSGTRDALMELVITPGCLADPTISALPAKDQEAACASLRFDGVYIDSGENDNVIIQKITSTPGTLGIFGYSFLDHNRDKVTALPLDGVLPSQASIADQSYRAARSLYLYYDAAMPHADRRGYIEEFLSDSAQDGYLKREGLIPLAPTERARMRQRHAQP